MKGFTREVLNVLMLIFLLVFTGCFEEPNSGLKDEGSLQSLFSLEKGEPITDPITGTSNLGALDFPAKEVAFELDFIVTDELGGEILYERSFINTPEGILEGIRYFSETPSANFRLLVSYEPPLDLVRDYPNEVKVSCDIDKDLIPEQNIILEQYSQHEFEFVSDAFSLPGAPFLLRCEISTNVATANEPALFFLYFEMLQF